MCISYHRGGGESAQPRGVCIRGGGLPNPGGVCIQKGLHPERVCPTPGKSASRRVYPTPEGSAQPWGKSASRGVCPTLGGLPNLGGSLHPGGSAQTQGVCIQGGVGQTTSPLWTEWHTRVKTLPCPKLRFWTVKIFTKLNNTSQQSYSDPIFVFTAVTPKMVLFNQNEPANRLSYSLRLRGRARDTSEPIFLV